MKFLLAILLLFLASCTTLGRYADSAMDTVIVGSSAALGGAVAGAPGAFGGASVGYLLVDNVDKIEFIEKHTPKVETVFKDPTANMLFARFKWLFIIGTLILLFTNPYKFLKAISYLFRSIIGLVSRALPPAKIANKDSP